ncbi:PREDICTED: cytochrome P450 71A3-like [Erythranthe guttata]|uniref:cytochrome P450 71A3-like n=1 Tax=Erythranthe guttata TaxID=4155 RepID=UPI00064DEC0E|nr:PREDICTED: cytochrome P450 71A3-like [Erythranthe guttata]|eukprot:XP_012838255.1 PREDICTED: cytochrome P450 71A3-like [Erythranthe guttata]
MVEQALGGVYLVLSLLGLTVLYLTRKWVVVYKKGGGGTKKLPPSPRKLPILGNLHQVSDLGHGPLELLGRKYGPIMLLQMGSKPVIIVQSADAAREIMKTNDLLFADRPHTVTTKRLCYNLKDMSVAPYGEHWRNLRSITTLKLLSAKMVQSFDFIRHEETSLLMEEIKNSAQPVNLSRLFWSLANDVICRAVFGRKYSSQSQGEGGDDQFLTLLGEA